VRHVRMLGLCLVAMFAVSAMTLGIASPALASKGEQKQEKLDKKNWDHFANCPWKNPKVELCMDGETIGGKNGGFFVIGKSQVDLSKPVKIQGGLWENSEGLLSVVAPENGSSTLEAPPLPVTDGLKLIKPEHEWPEALTTAFEEAIKNHETGLDAKIEVGGGTVLYETPGALNTTNLIFEEGAAFKLPLKVKLTGPFLEKLGGGPCVIGNETTPIEQELTSEPKADGSAGELEILNEGDMVALRNGRLGDDGWSIPKAADAQGCGGEYETYLNKAIDRSLGQGYENEAYNSKGLTLLSGSLYESVAKTTREYLEEGIKPPS
jgi:hypothetical protein